MAYYEYELRSEVAAAYFEVVAYGASSKTTSETKPKHTCVLFVAPTGDFFNNLRGQLSLNDPETDGTSP